MSELIGQLLLLGLMVWILRFVIGARIRRRDSFKRYERPPTAWWHSLQWIPIGYATAQLLGAGAPLNVVAVAAALAAAIQRIFPRPFEIVVGGGAGLVAVLQAVEGSGCRPPIGALGIVLLATFGGAAIAIIILSGRLILKTSQYLSASAGMIELTLLATGPAGGTLIATYGLGALGLLVVVLLLSAAIGAEPELGLAAVGTGVIAGEVILASVPGMCDRTAQHVILGAVVFATTRLFLSRRSNRALLGLR